MNILITGASGFIGQHLLTDLKNTDYTLFVVTRDQKKIIPGVSENTQVIIADLTNLSSLEKAFENIDVLINIAAEVRNAEKLESTNVLGSKNIIQAASKNKVKKIIHLSSVGVVGMQYSNIDIEIDEDAFCDPKNQYEKTKYQSEQILIDGCMKNNIKLSILRPTNVFGENHPFDAVLKLMKRITDHKTMIVAAGAKANYIYVKDLTAAIVSLIASNENSIFNIGYSVSYKALIELLDHLTNNKTTIITLPNALFISLNTLGVKKLNVISNKVTYNDDRLKSFFTYPCGLEIGLRNTYNYFQQKGLIK